MTPRQRMSVTEISFLLGQLRAQTYTSARATLVNAMNSEFNAGYDAGVAAIAGAIDGTTYESDRRGARADDL